MLDRWFDDSLNFLRAIFKQVDYWYDNSKVCRREWQTDL